MSESVADVATADPTLHNNPPDEETNGRPSRLPLSCSTFLLSQAEDPIVGHSLDDCIRVPALAVANPRRAAKENSSWQDMRVGRSKFRRRVRWASKHGSITDNAFGQEFPDGAMNEAGLYAGEMTLLGTVCPQGEDLPKMYRHQWVQFLLEHFETAEQVVAELRRVLREVTAAGRGALADTRTVRFNLRYSPGPTLQSGSSRATSKSQDIRSGVIARPVVWAEAISSCQVGGCFACARPCLHRYALDRTTVSGTDRYGACTGVAGALRND